MTEPRPSKDRVAQFLQMVLRLDANEGLSPKALGALQDMARRRLAECSADEPDECPRCRGSGEVKAMTQWHGPDDYEFDAECPNCKGVGVVNRASQPQPEPPVGPMSRDELMAICKRFVVEGYNGDYLENDGFDLAREVEGMTLNRCGAAQPQCAGCNGHGSVGGLLPDGGGYESEPCPFCSPQPPGAWQPIETAPHDELIQLYWPDICDKPVAGFYEKTTCGSGWHTAINAFAWQTSPTHWMPLPSPPTKGDAP